MGLRIDLHLSRRPAIGFGLLGLFWGSFAALVPQIKAGIGAGDALFGTLLLMSSVGLVSAMWLAPLADRRLGALGLPAGLILMALSFLVVGSADTPALFGAGMFLAGCGSGLTDVIINARVSEIEARESRPLMNLNHAIFSFVYAGSALAAGMMREAGAEAIAVFSVHGAIALGLCLLARAEPHRADPATGGAHAPLPMDVVVFGGLVVMIAFMAEASMESWSALHVERSLGGRAVEGALGPFMLGLTMGFGRLSGQVVAARFRDTRVIFWAALMTAAGALVAAVAPVPVVAYAGFAILGLGVSVIAPLGLGLAGRRADVHSRTRVIARVSVIGFMGFFLAPTVMGYLAELASLRWAFTAVAGLVLLIPSVLVRRL